jgi:hypothetical protein
MGLLLVKSSVVPFMPRFKFQWSNLATDLLQELAWGMGLSGDPADALKKRFGVRPGEEFAKQAWPLLLQFWLGNDQIARDELAGTLRSKGLGKTEIKDQIAYLKSCNNSSSLRAEVNRLFLVLGEQAQQEDRPTTRSNETQHTQAIQESFEAEDHPEELTRDSMLAFAKGVIAAMYKVDEEDLFVDSDGDLFIPAGSAGIFLRVMEAPDEFRIFSPLLSDVEESPMLYALINQINSDLRFGCLYYSNRSIILDHGLIGRTISPLQLAIIVDTLADTADFYDHRLQEKLGGAVFLRERDEDEIEV